MFVYPLKATTTLRLVLVFKIRGQVSSTEFVFVAGYSLFFILPVVVAQDVMPITVTKVTTSFMGSGSVTLTLACHSLITALSIAFSTVYDARLVMQHRSFGANLAHATYDGVGVSDPFIPGGKP